MCVAPATHTHALTLFILKQFYKRLAVVMKIKIEIEKIISGDGFLNNGLSTLRVFDPEDVILLEQTESNENVGQVAREFLEFALDVLGLED